MLKYRRISDHPPHEAVERIIEAVKKYTPSNQAIFSDLMTDELALLMYDFKPPVASLPLGSVMPSLGECPAPGYLLMDGKRRLKKKYMYLYLALKRFYSSQLKETPNYFYMLDWRQDGEALQYQVKC